MPSGALSTRQKHDIVGLEGKERGNLPLNRARYIVGAKTSRKGAIFAPGLYQKNSMEEGK
jgi:hypothetical protein